jgi:opacity protein-like surface antigen
MSRLAAAAVALALVATPALAATPSQETAAAGKVLDRFHAAAAASDFKTYFDQFAPQGVFIGTDAHERWTVGEFKAYAKPAFDARKGWVYTPRERHLAITQDPCRCVVWFDEILDSKSYGTSRGTGVLVKTPKGWKIAQYALTFPIPNDLAKDTTDRIKAYEAGRKP